MSNLNNLDEWRDETLKCIRCGLCRSVCPVFDAIGTEASVSRGKVQLIRALQEGRLEPTKTLKDIVSLCLTCGACTPNCPSAIKVHEVILAARADLLAELGRPMMEKLLLRDVAGHSERMALGAKAAAIYQKTGLRWLAQKTRLLSLLPGDLDAKADLLPEIPLRAARSVIPEVTGPSKARMRVGYFLGCTSNLIEPAVAEATVEVLAKSGCEVVTPARLECCGMPHLNYGDVEMAEKLERINVEILNDLDVEAVIVDCATCGGRLKKYGDLKAPVYDVSEFLVDVVSLDDLMPNETLEKVTYHDPCHLVRGQGISVQPRQLLNSIPGIQLVEMAEADRCCGGGGSFNLTHYELSMAILDKKVNNIFQTEATAVVTGCPSCRMQLSYGIRRAAKKLAANGDKNTEPLLHRVVHPIELLAVALK